MVRVFDSVLPESYIDNILNQNIDFHETWQNGIDSIKQWIHVCKKEPTDNIFVLLKKSLNYLENKTDIKVLNILRCKLNIIKPMQVNDITISNMIHIDTDQEDGKEFNSAIFYLNDADGDTVFFDKNKKETFRCSPKKGRVVFFSSHMLHRATPPIQNERRVINFVLETN